MLLLASASPARQRLLAQARIPHRVRASGVDEDACGDPDASGLVLRLAHAKAMASHEADRRAGSPLPSSGVLGCDSVLELDGEIFGKPGSVPEAVVRWRRMAGRWGALHTGHCLLRWAEGGGEGQPPEVLQDAVITRVRFAPLGLEEIEAYVATGEPLHCAGGFALEGSGGLAIEAIEGCVSNVIGLSLPLLRRWLHPWGDGRSGGNPSKTP